MSNQLVPIQDRINLAYAAGYRAGVRDVGDIQVMYLHPLLQDVANLSSIVSMIRGVALAGSGMVRMEMIKELAGDFVKAWARVDMEIERAEQSGFYEDVRGAFYLERYQSIYTACKAYYSGADPDGAALRELAQRIPLEAPNLFELRALGAGVSKSPAVDFIAREGEKLLKAFPQLRANSRKDCLLIGRRILNALEMRRDELVGDELDAYISLRECIGAAGVINERQLQERVRTALRRRNGG